MLKHFSVDVSRHLLTVDVEFYQMDLKSVVETALESELEALRSDTTGLPSWSKFVANPVKAKGFFTNMLQAVFEGKGNDASLNIDYQTGRKAAEGKTKVAMMFLPGSTTNVNLQEIIPIAEQALKGFTVVPVYGETMTNATAERAVSEAVEKAFKENKSTLILSAGMAQRSFSIPKIVELFLAYDTGDNGATIQKMSRALTPDQIGKIARVVSLSFDPNRDDKFDAMLIETAQNYKKNKGIADLKEALRTVLHTVDIFKCQQDGSVKIEVDEYLEQALARDSIDRVIGKTADLSGCSAEMIRAIAAGKSEVFRAAQVAAAERGKTRLTKAPVKRGPNVKDASKSEMAKAREVLVTISQNIDIIRYYGGTNLDEAFALIDVAPVIVRDGISMDFGVDYDLIKDLINTGRIKRDLLDLKFS